MSLTKILDSDITTNGVQSAPDKLTGTAAENKAVFDKLIANDTASVKKRFNDLIDALVATTGAAEIGASVTGVSGTTVQAILSAYKTLIDSSVKITTMTLTESEKAIARDNIGVTGAEVAVNSVNSRTGAVTLSASDVGMAGVKQTKTSVSLPTASWVQTSHLSATGATTITSGTVTVDSDTFLEEYSTVGSYVWTYDSTNLVWKKDDVSYTDADLTALGITYTGTASNNNTITVTVATVLEDDYKQAITISGTTSNSKVDLQPDSTVITQLVDDGCNGLYVENNSGTLTCYAVGDKPSTDLTIQATYYEVTT